VQRVVRSRTLRSTGVAESLVADRIAGIPGGVGTVELAYLPNADGVDLRLTVRELPPDEADARLAAAASRVRGVMGTAIYGEGEADLAAVVLEACRARSLRLAVAESCTGGMLGARLTAVPGSSAVVRGGVIAYDDAIKESLLGVRAETLHAHGAVSEQVAREMASGARTRLDVGAALAITGIAGPDGGSEAKPVGTVWIALDLEGAVEARLLRLWGDREEVRRRSAQAALELLRRALLPSRGD
jgi:nicotinamide-nucleotide amidase